MGHKAQVDGFLRCGLVVLRVYTVEQVLLEQVTKGPHTYVKMKG